MWRRSKKHTGAPTTEDTRWTDQSQCRLLQLPPELRNRIYMYALVDDDHQRRNIGLDLRSLRKPALMSTCRQIEFEALPLIFGNNCFRLVIIIGKDWRKLPTLTPATQAWITRAGDLAQPFRYVKFIINKPNGRHHFMATLTADVGDGICTDESPTIGLSATNVPWPAANSLRANYNLRCCMDNDGRNEVNMDDLELIADGIFHLSSRRSKRWLKARFGGDRVDRWSSALRGKIQRSYLRAPRWVANIIWYAVEKVRNEKARKVVQLEEELEPGVCTVDGAVFPRDVHDLGKFFFPEEDAEHSVGEQQT